MFRELALTVGSITDAAGEDVSALEPYSWPRSFC